MVLQHLGLRKVYYRGTEGSNKQAACTEGSKQVPLHHSKLCVRVCVRVTQKIDGGSDAGRLSLKGSLQTIQNELHGT